MSDALGIVLQGRAADQAISLYRYWRQLTTPAGASVVYSAAEQQYLAGLGSRLFVPPQATLVNAFLQRVDLQHDVGLGVLSPAARVEVVGHSLGGHLAQMFAVMFPQNVEHVLTYNAAGIGGVTIHSANLLSSLLGAGAPLAGTRIENIIADHGPDFTAGFATLRGSVDRVFNEQQLNPIANHYIANLTDALALYDLFSALDPALASRSIKTILDSVSPSASSSLEAALDGLRGALRTDVVSALASTQSDRNAYYTNLLALRDSVESQGLAGTLTVVSLAQVLPEALLSNALGADAQAFRYALAQGNAYALLGLDYARHNQNGQLDLGGEDSAVGALTRAYLTDRSQYLPLQWRFNAADGQFIVQGQTQYRDLRTGAELLPSVLGDVVIFGADANDTIEALSGKVLRGYGGFGDDVLTGQNGNDYLEGGPGNDSLRGGEGADRLVGGAGFDTYVWNDGDGADVIADADGSGRIMFDGVALTGGGRIGHGIYLSADESMQYAFAGPTGERGTLIINNGLRIEDFRNGDLGITLAGLQEEESPADYVVLYGDSPVPTNLDPEAARLYPLGSHLNDSFSGGIAWQPEFVGRGGDDYMEVAIGTPVQMVLFRGGAGDDTLVGRATGIDLTALSPSFHFFAGEGGADTITGTAEADAIYGDFDRISLREFSASFSRVLLGSNQFDGSAGAGYTLVLSRPDLDPMYDIPDDLGTFESIESAAHYYISGNPLPGMPVTFNDHVEAGAGDDFVEGGSGDDTLYGGAGDDVMYGDASGADMPYRSIDWNGLEDLRYLFGEPGNDFIDGGDGDDLISDDFGSSEVHGGAGDDSIVIVAARPDASPDMPLSVYIDAGPGDDQLFVSTFLDDAVLVRGGDGDDVFDGASFGARYEGGRGNDEFRISFPFTNEFSDYDPEPGNIDRMFLPDMELFPGLAVSATTLRPSRDGMDLRITIDPALVPEEFEFLVEVAGITVRDWFLGPSHHIEEFVFGDGSGIWTPADIDALLAQQQVGASTGDDTVAGGDDADLLYASAGNDTLRGLTGDDALFGEDGDDVLIGGAGNDMLAGGAGSDTYRYELGDGDDLILDAAEAGALNILSFGEGIAADSLFVVPDGLGVLTAEGEARITLAGFDPSGEVHAIDRIEFHGGATLTLAALLGAGIDLEGTNGADGLVGSRHGDRIRGGRGDDTLVGAEGDDDYRFEGAWGKDLVVDYGGGVNTLRFGEGIAADDLAASWRDGRLVLARADGNEVAIEWEPAEGYRVDRAVFADGTVWDSAQLDALVEAGQVAAEPEPPPEPDPVPEPGPSPAPEPPAQPETLSDLASLQPAANLQSESAPVTSVTASAVALPASVAGTAPLPASVPPEIQQLISQFFDRIQPPPMSMQSWIDSWPVARDASRSVQQRESDLTREAAPASAGGEPAAQGAEPNDAPMIPEAQPESGLTPDEVAARYAAMHAWIDAHPPSGADGDLDGAIGLRQGGFLQVADSNAMPGMPFSTTAGLAPIAGSLFQPLQGLREGYSVLGWS